MVEFKPYPSILKSKNGDCFLMIHVDDLLVVGTRKAVMEELTPALKTKYTVSVETMSKGGDEVSFLKRSHCLIDDGRMLIKYVSPQALGSAMQASSHVPEGSVQKDARSL